MKESENVLKVWKYFIFIKLYKTKMDICKTSEIVFLFRRHSYKNQKLIVGQSYTSPQLMYFYSIIINSFLIFFLDNGCFLFFPRREPIVSPVKIFMEPRANREFIESISLVWASCEKLKLTRRPEDNLSFFINSTINFFFQEKP